MKYLRYILVGAIVVAFSPVALVVYLVLEREPTLKDFLWLLKLLITESWLDIL